MKLGRYYMVSDDLGKRWYGLGRYGSSGVGKKWIGLGYVLICSLENVLNDCDFGKKGKRRFKDNVYMFGLSSWLYIDDI